MGCLMGCLCKKRSRNEELINKINEDFDIEKQNEDIEKKKRVCYISCSKRL
jgi:hypothetical protein